ncbi:uncharacterized protein LOC111612726 [Centruroides sculpturatus]|uniref:uncharacterized protein LOC111612726 n=1 Tax=Centruroides sculpturatus TaxID=218467 RepID=UPI000C6D448C|nr:uncharacterized protein LOC111612726 [Centruroides sculpturatus]
MHKVSAMYLSLAVLCFLIYSSSGSIEEWSHLMDDDVTDIPYRSFRNKMAKRVLSIFTQNTPFGLNRGGGDIPRLSGFFRTSNLGSMLGNRRPFGNPLRWG